MLLEQHPEEVLLRSFDKVVLDVVMIFLALICMKCGFTLYHKKTPVKLYFSPIVGDCGYPWTDRELFILKSILLI